MTLNKKSQHSSQIRVLSRPHNSLKNRLSATQSKAQWLAVTRIRTRAAGRTKNKITFCKKTKSDFRKAIMRVSRQSRTLSRNSCTQKVARVGITSRTLSTTTTSIISLLETPPKCQPKRSWARLKEAKPPLLTCKDRRASEFNQLSTTSTANKIWANNYQTSQAQAVSSKRRESRLKHSGQIRWCTASKCNRNSNHRSTKSLASQMEVSHSQCKVPNTPLKMLITTSASPRPTKRRVKNQTNSKFRVWFCSKTKALAETSAWVV